ncbi:Bromodomain-containing protein [Macroventuria anomochaeta]|uniref:Bromodomain-containing protein n=1 Tax=Macroventuria anomochaeta TaxID=301207 RepID=A0ACB6RSL9_9PLEO|nr:Bromodomain-containing protein [Macroventuria anomochaeta]KAF2624128.1 Bromodomain-containing protein [Macroventuria anomochaeta]
MAVMTSPTFDKSTLDLKADALAPADAMAIDTEPNGHFSNCFSVHDDLFDEPVNGTDANATEESKPTTNGNHTASDVPAPAVEPAVQPVTDVSSSIDDNNSLFGDDLAQSVTEATEAPISDVRDEPAPAPPANPAPVETQIATSIEPASADAMDTTADAPEDSKSAPPTKPMKELSIQPESTTPAKDAPQSGKSSGPEAKRTKTEEASSSQLVQTNGSSTLRGDGTATPRGIATVISSEPSGVHRAADYEAWPTTPMTQAQNKFLLERIRNTKKIKVSLAFKDPVDHIALNIPTYPTIVTKPMDLSTMESKLKENKYTYIKNFMEDLDQMIENSELFNNKQHPVTQAGYNLRAYFLKGMSKMPRGAVDEPQKPAKAKKPSVSMAPKAARRESRPAPPTVKSPAAAAAASPPAAWPLGQDGMPLIRRDSTSANDRPKREIHRPSKDLPYANAKPRKKKYQQELKFCESILTEIMKPKYQPITYPFVVPVDPVALNIPSYLKIIKKPMDFGTIEKNFKNGVYQSAKDFHADCMLVFQNCYKFNPEGDAVNAMGHQMEDLFNSLWKEKADWLAQHAPAPEQSPEVYSDEEDEEEDEEDEEVDAAQAQFLAIQQQIAALNETAQQLLNAQKGGKRASPKAPNKKKAKAPAPVKKKTVPLAVPPPVKAGKPKAKVKPPQPLSFAQKQDISEGISTLGDADMRKAVQIIRNGCPHLANVHDDEMELDMDEINDETLRELLKFIKSLRGPKGGASVADDDFEPPRPVHKQTTASRPKKNKPMGKTEQEDNMRKIQEKLQSFQGGASGSSQSPPGMLLVRDLDDAVLTDAAHEEESSDDDSGSESEEE